MLLNVLILYNDDNYVVYDDFETKRRVFYRKFNDKKISFTEQSLFLCYDYLSLQRMNYESRNKS